MFNIFRKSLVDILPQVRGKYQKNVSLSKHTWFGVGGPAEIMYHPADAEDLCRFIKEKPYNLPVCLIGGGSNLLIRDGGVPGVVIKLDSPAFRRITVDGDQITCGAGVKNSELKKSGKETVIVRLRNKFMPYFKDTKYYSVFNILTGQLEDDKIDINSIDRMVNDVAAFSNFAKIYSNSLKLDDMDRDTEE